MFCSRYSALYALYPVTVATSTILPSHDIDPFRQDKDTESFQGQLISGKYIGLMGLAFYFLRGQHLLYFTN